jgi:hypothetical protein
MAVNATVNGTSSCGLLTWKGPLKPFSWMVALTQADTLV